MSKKYNIHVNPKGLSKEQIDKHKDFNALLDQYQNTAGKPKPIYRRMSFWAAAVAAAIAAFFVINIGIDSDQPSYDQNMAHYFDNQPYINPPLPQAKAKFASYEVDVNQGGVFEYPTGSKLIVPVAAFTHKDGSPVAGAVTIKYREMHDFVDFFLSGIPMTYDSAGVKYTLESAGMIEIYAEQDGSRVNMAPGKSIDVELVSNVNVPAQMNVPPGYNIYKLDEERKNWVYQVVDQMELMDDRLPEETLDADNPLFLVQKELKETMQSLQVSYDNDLAKLEKSLPKAKKPLEPSLANPDEFVFDLDFDDLKDQNAAGEIAETQKELEALYRQYEKMLWQLSPGSGITAEELQQGFSNVTDISIRKINSNTYELTLKKDEESLDVKVNPVLSGSDYEMAQAAFERDFDRYEAQIADRSAKLAAQKALIEEAYEAKRNAANELYEEGIAKLKANGMNYAATQEIIKRKVLNRFTADGFGIWNCDRPIPPEMLILAANFKDESGNNYNHKTAYLVDKSRNTVYRFLAEDNARMTINMSSENLLWLVTEDNKIAVFRPEEFKSIEKGVKEFDFVMQKIDKEIEDENDVREILYL